MIIRLEQPYPVIRHLGDLSTQGIPQGTLGEALTFDSETGVYGIRFTESKYVELLPNIDFVFIEGDYSRCFGYRNRQKFLPWSYFREINLQEVHNEI